MDFQYHLCFYTFNVKSDTSSIKDLLLNFNTSKTIGGSLSSQTLDTTPPAVNITALACTQGYRYPQTASTGFKASTSLQLHMHNASAQLPLLKGSSSALWPRAGGLCHWDTQDDALLPPLVYDSWGDLISWVTVIVKVS